MATYVDNFNRDNEDPLLSPWSTSTAPGLGAFGIQLSNNRVFGGGGGTCVSVLQELNWNNDQSSGIEIVTATLFNDPYVLVRADENGNGYFGKYEHNQNRMLVGKFENGFTTEWIDQGSSGLVDGDRMVLNVTGNTLTLSINETVIHTYVDNENSFTEGSPGLGYRNGDQLGTILDNFESDGWIPQRILSVGTDNIVTDGEQDFPVINASFDNDIDTVALRVGNRTVDLSGFSGTGANYTADVMDVTTFNSNGIVGLPFSSPTHQNQIVVSNALESAFLNITRNPKAGYQIVDVINASTDLSSWANGRVDGAPSDGSQLLYETKENTIVLSNLITKTDANSLNAWLWDIDTGLWESLQMDFISFASNPNGWDINNNNWVRQILSPFYDGRTPTIERETGVSAVSMSLDLTSSGRLGFFIDYSELDDVGTHTFYANRTHGSQGVVSCQWTAYDSTDGSELDSGILFWDNQSVDILSFDVDVPNKSSGDHRIYVLLSNPSGGAVLHHGDHTVAFGIIDDNTIVDSNAIFIDADATTDGDGTEGNPYNNWYSARVAVLPTTRFIYIKGQILPDGTDTGIGGADPGIKHLNITSEFTGRSNESERLVIRNWPGFVGGLDGVTETDVAGFHCNIDDANLDYITFRKLTVENLNTSSLSSSIGSCFFLWTKGAHNFITMENCDIDNITAGANAANAVLYTDGAIRRGYKLWRNTYNNLTHGNVVKNLHVFEAYNLGESSIQRCTLGPVTGSIYDKQAGTGLAGLSIRFNQMGAGTVRFSSQSTHIPHSFTIVQHNLFDGTREQFDYDTIRYDFAREEYNADKHWIVGNVFYNYNFSTQATVDVEKALYTNVIMFNNIHHLNQRAWKFESNSPEYADYNLYYDLANSIEFINNGTTYNNFSDLQSSTSFEQNSVISEPLFTDQDNNDFTLQNISPALSSGLSGTNIGLYIGNFYEIGAQ